MTIPAHGARGRAPTPVEEALFVTINGAPQWITIRGADRANPVLLLICGAGASFSRMAAFFAPWERAFTLVQWDQPGAGSTYAKNGAPEVFTFDALAGDGVALTQIVRERLGAQKIIILCVSGGTIIGLKMIKQRPDMYFAYVGNGQIVNRARQEALSYAMVLHQARAAGDRPAVAQLEEIGPPPWSDVASDAIKSQYANAMTTAERASFDPALLVPPPGAAYIAAGLPAPDVRACAMAAFVRLKQEMGAFDAAELGLSFQAPLVFLQGRLDAHTVTSEVQAYFAAVHAPSKHLELIEEGGHMSIFLRDRMLALLMAHVRPLADDQGRVQDDKA